jgi:hypothetical protein
MRIARQPRKSRLDRRLADARARGEPIEAEARREIGLPPIQRKAGRPSLKQYGEVEDVDNKVSLLPETQAAFVLLSDRRCADIALYTLCRWVTETTGYDGVCGRRGNAKSVRRKICDFGYAKDAKRLRIIAAFPFRPAHLPPRVAEAVDRALRFAEREGSLPAELRSMLGDISASSDDLRHGKT